VARELFFDWNVFKKLSGKAWKRHSIFDDQPCGWPPCLTAVFCFWFKVETTELFISDFAYQPYHFLAIPNLIADTISYQRCGHWITSWKLYCSRLHKIIYWCIGWNSIPNAFCMYYINLFCLSIICGLGNVNLERPFGSKGNTACYEICSTLTLLTAIRFPHMNEMRNVSVSVLCILFICAL